MESRIAAIKRVGEIVVNRNRVISDDDGNQQLVLMDEFVPICGGVFAEYNTKEQRSINESTTKWSNYSDKMENIIKYRRSICGVERSRCSGNVSRL